MHKKLYCERDNRVRYYVMPKRVVWSDNGSGKIENIDDLLEANNKCCLLKSGATAGISFVLDFGAELNGGIRIDLSECHDVGAIAASRRVRFRIRFGESVSEVMGLPSQDHAVHDTVLELPFWSIQEFGLTGFRFVRLDLLEQNLIVSIRSIKAVALERPFEYKGRFESSDPLLDQIWLTGARTTHLCCQDYILDGIKRDRLVWIGDIHPQIHIIVNAFGNEDIVPKSLNFLRDQMLPGHWMNDISSYSMWWILSVWDWYWYSGDKEFLRSQAAYLEELIDHFVSKIDPSGREMFGGYFMDCIDPSEKQQLEGIRFLDWASDGDHVAIAEGLQALFVWSMSVAQKIYGELADPIMHDKCRVAVERLRSAPLTHTKNKQVSALRTICGISDPQITNASCLAIEPSKGLSTWFAYYVLQARAMAGDYCGCLDLIRSFWGGMSSLGATTFWEHFDEAWLHNAGRIDEITPVGKHDVHAEYGYNCFKGLRHSLCHGWAGGPTAWLSQNVLGVQPVAPGFREVIIKPNLGNLTFAKGVVPTPFGLITVSHKRQADGTIHTEYDVPTDVNVSNK